MDALATKFASIMLQVRAPPALTCRALAVVGSVASVVSAACESAPRDRSRGTISREWCLAWKLS